MEESSQRCIGRTITAAGVVGKGRVDPDQDPFALSQAGNRLEDLIVVRALSHVDEMDRLSSRFIVQGENQLTVGIDVGAEPDIEVIPARQLAHHITYASVVEHEAPFGPGEGWSEVDVLSQRELAAARQRASISASKCSYGCCVGPRPM